MGKLIKRILIALCVLGLIGAAAIAWRLRPRTQRFYTDADTIKMPQEAAAVREILWTPPKQLAGGFNAGVDDYEPELSEDGQTLFFVRGRAGANADIDVCRRTADGWSEPQPLGAINSEYDELGPELSPDGKTLYFYSDRPGGIGGYDIWRSQRQTDGTWSEPSNLGANVNSAWNDYGPATSPKGDKLYFASNRPKPGEVVGTQQANWPATLREAFEHRDYDLYCAMVSEHGFTPAVQLAALSTDANEGAPAVSPFGDFLYFASDRDGGFGGYDVYRCRIVRGEYREPTNLGAEVNTAANELDPDLSLGGYGLHFSSDRRADARPGDNAAFEQATLATYGLYYTTSREVFSETETQQASINWAGLWRDIAPNLLWALLALLLSLLLLALMRDFRERKLSLLARCLLASLLLHMLLMLLLNVVEVTTALASVVRGKGRIQVSLVSSAVGDELSSQLFGQMTDVESPAPPTPSATKQDVQLEMPATYEAATSIEVASPAAVAESPAVPIDVADDAPTPEREPPTPPTVDAAPIEFAAQSPSELAMPMEQRQVSAAEESEPAQPEIAQQRTAKVSTKPMATTQPALPASDREIEPAALAIAIDARPTIALNSVPAEDAQPDVLAARTDAVSITDTPMASAPPRAAALAMPAEERPHTDATEPSNLAPADAIAPKSPEPTRADVHLTAQAFSGEPNAAASLLLSVVDDPPPPALTETRAATPGWADASDADTNDAPIASRTMSTPPEPPAFAASSQRSASDDIRLPSGEPPNTLPDERTSEPAAKSAEVRVAPDWRPIERADSGAAAFTGAAQPQMCETPVAPTRSRGNVSADTIATPIVATSETAADATPSNTAARPAPLSDTAIGSEPVVAATAPIDLALPSEIEPPSRAEESGNSIGTIRGNVVDRASGMPLPGAIVQLVLADEQTISVEAGSQGEYELAVPHAPDNFALSASSEGHVPLTTNIAKLSLGGRPLDVDFRLEPKSEFIVATEERPDVHHLGNDRFEGRINSQFQKNSEGRTFRTRFVLTQAQLATRHRRGEIKLMVKGVQCPHQIRLNGRLLDTRLDNAPRDGSFGEFTAEFDPAWLAEGVNRLKIRGVECSGDLDDFEFVNIRICLYP